MKVIKNNFRIFSGLEEYALQLFYIELEIQELQHDFCCARSIDYRLKINQEINQLISLRNFIEEEMKSLSHLQITKFSCDSVITGG